MDLRTMAPVHDITDFSMHRCLHRLQETDRPWAQRYRRGRDFGIDGRDGFDRPVHIRFIAYSLYTFDR